MSVFQDSSAKTRLLLASSIAFATMSSFTGSAHAAYKVIVSAESAGQLSYGRGYNAGTYVSGAPGGPGYSAYSNACDSTKFSACLVGGTGNTEADPTLTAATESTSVDSTTLPSYYYPLGLHAAASAYATASLASASVGIADSGTYGESGCCSGQDGGHGNSSAETIDVLHFAATGAPSILGITFHVHGGMNAFTPLGDSTGDLTAVYALGGGFFEGSVLSGPGNNYTPTFGEAGQTGGWLTDSVTENAPGDFTFNATYGLTGAAQDLGIVEYLQESCGGGTACDYAHTATVSFTLPKGVTFTSDSGVFLTSPEGGGVPEPAGWALMILGIGMLGGAARRSRPVGVEAA